MIFIYIYIYIIYFFFYSYFLDFSTFSWILVLFIFISYLLFLLFSYILLSFHLSLFKSCSYPQCDIFCFSRSSCHGVISPSGINKVFLILILINQTVWMEPKPVTHWLSPRCRWRSRRAPGAREARGRKVSKLPWWHECPPNQTGPNLASPLRDREEGEKRSEGGGGWGWRGRNSDRQSQRKWTQKRGNVKKRATKCSNPER